MAEWIVMTTFPEGGIKGLGAHSFRESPRRGDYITMDNEKGEAQIYEVTAILIPLKQSANAGDIHIRHLGSLLEWRRKNLDKSQPKGV